MLAVGNKKKCSKCQKWFEGDLSLYFGKLKSAGDGLDSRCKECARLHLRQNRINKKAQGLCLDCSTPISLASNHYCFKHFIGHLYSSSHMYLGNRKAKISADWASQLEAKWVAQGGNPNGTGFAVCPTTGRSISFIQKTATIGHLKSTSELQNEAFAHPNNIIWQDAQWNLSQQNYIPTSNEPRPESAYVFYTWSNGRLKGQHPSPLLRQLWYSQKWVCPYFGYSLYDTTQAQIDHIIPISKGGDHSLENLQFISCAANRAKGQLSHKEFTKWCIEVGHLSTFTQPNRLSEVQL